MPYLDHPKIELDKIEFDSTVTAAATARRHPPSHAPWVTLGLHRRLVTST